MNSQTFTKGADISRTLFRCVVKSSSGSWPHFEITTPLAVFHLVAIEKVASSTVADGMLTRIVFTGKEPIGRAKTFVWPPQGVEEPAALSIIALSVYEN